MKKIIVLCIVFVMASAAAGLAKTEEKAHDGWWWKMMMPTERTAFIKGYLAGILGGAEQAATIACFHGNKRTHTDDCVRKITEEIYQFFRNPVTDDIEENLDNFYSSIFTNKVGIVDAMTVVSMKTGGYGEFADCLTEALSEQVETFRETKLAECARLPHPLFVDPTNMMHEDK
jgi:hypothetical protein